ncbi:helix-turn-helix domain-containing protein [Sporosarcina sp. Sa2YVA2]|uniref:Helix-turn-helix domain-containing protein n=1 Tax=Sporosarcina quadrami TaxID=2762234 RepID=A0ABR8UAL4_9BACL|nr:helix-turn-helix domain-containing protein [Sporosarcina quadrami]MBD7984784.1 helix-turn-helix domain-containing protein [Sporosarcina quadrami]
MQPNLIGKKIKELRRKKDMTQQQLAELTGFTKSLISKIENGQTGSAVATLSKIASVLGVTLSWLLQEESDAELIIMKAAQRKTIEAGEEASYLYQSLANLSTNSKIEPVIVTVIPGKDKIQPYTHEEDEFIYILSGKINFSYDGKTTILQSGDSAFFKGKTPHVFLPIDALEAKVLTIFISND